ncbi:MAG: DsbA family protein [Pararhodobacter sp.]|nr:DsbA family protein [Pararhodobacter sp.]
MNRNLLLIASLVVLVAGGAYLFLARDGQPQMTEAGMTEAGGDAPEGANAGTESDAEGASVDTSGVVEMVRGDPDAPVTIVEYSSFTCPHCANFNQGIYRQLMENYVETGQVYFIKREVYFDAYGLWAALVARCGGPERYHGIVEMIYAEQRRWAGSNDGAEVADNLRRIGRRAGLNNEQLDACLSDRDMATALMEVYRGNAERYGIRSTPSFVINGELHGNMSYGEFEQVIAAAAGD